MARIEVVMPQMGESIAEGTIVKWHKKVGEQVKRDETLLEISTDKVDSEIPSPAAGVLSQILVEEQKTVPVRTIIAYLETNGGTASAGTAQPPAPPQRAAAPVMTATQGPAQARVPAPAQGAAPAVQAAGRFYSPLVLNIARTEGVSMAELEQIPGTGEGGRVTKKDILSFVEARRSAPATSVVSPRAARQELAGAPPPAATDLRSKYAAAEPDILQMSTVQQKMAQHMVASVQTSPHVAAIQEVDMTDIVKHRAEQGEAFEKAEGFRLTYTPYILEAVVKAVKKFPLINSSVEGDKIIRKNVINLGIAVASENGLLVPVIKHAEEKNFLGLARAVSDLAQRTRSKKLLPEDVQGGTITVTNYGVFGTTIGTPIINQPQVAILGTGAIRKTVAAVNDMIAIRSIAYFTLSFDHRIIDGALGGMFLAEIVQSLEHFDTSMRF